jgi:hypothetical protein
MILISSIGLTRNLGSEKKKEAERYKASLPWPRLRGCSSTVFILFAGLSYRVTISALCLKGEGGGISQYRFWANTDAALEAKMKEIASRVIRERGIIILFIIGSPKVPSG